MNASSRYCIDSEGRRIKPTTEFNNKIENFLKELNELYSKYNLTISHEAGYGAFILETYKISNMRWMEQAVVVTNDGEIISDGN